jgi:superfamily II DNA helicase RecQ
VAGGRLEFGQDFRPDYRYVARFIHEAREAAPDKTLPLIQCLTATAKPEVVAENRARVVELDARLQEIAQHTAALQQMTT